MHRLRDHAGGQSRSAGQLVLGAHTDRPLRISTQYRLPAPSQQHWPPPQQQQQQLPQLLLQFGQPLLQACNSRQNGIHQGATYSTVCHSSSSSSSDINPGRDSVDLGLSIFEAGSWQQLYELFYDYHNTPSYQHCYSILMQLAELLPELQQQPGGGPGLGFGPGSDLPAVPHNPTKTLRRNEVSGGSSSSSSSSAVGAGGWEAVWQALSAGGKVQSWTQLSRLRALIRDVLRAVQVQLHLYQPHELLDVLEAALLLSRPSTLWMQVWQAAMQPHLKQLQLVQLMRVGQGLLGYGHHPSKPWAGLWFIALQSSLSQCASQELAIISLSLKRWGCKPPLSWTEPYMEALQLHMASMTAQQLLAVAGAGVALHLKPWPSWLQGFEVASQGLLADCLPSELSLLLQGLQLLGHTPSHGWLLEYLAAVHAGIRGWDVETLASMLVVLGQLEPGQTALEEFDKRKAVTTTGDGSSSSSSQVGARSSSSTGVDGSSGSDNSNNGLLAVIAAHAEPLIEHTDNPGSLVKLLRGFHTLNFTPSDAWLDLLLDEAAEKIGVNSRALHAKFYKSSGGGSHSSLHNSSSSDGGSGLLSGRGPQGEKPASDGSSSSGSSSSGIDGTLWVDGEGGFSAEEQEAEQPWLLQPGSYQRSRNLNLARRNLESSWLLDSMEENDNSTSSSSSKGLNRQPSLGSLAPGQSRTASSGGGGLSSSSSGGGSGFTAPSSLAGGAAAGAAAAGVQALAASSVVVGHVLGLLSVVAAMKLPVERSWVAEVMRALQGHCRVIDLPELQQLLALLEVYGPVLDPEAVDELLVQCHVNFSRLSPLDTLRLLGLLAASQTRPNNIWWQGFLATLQESLPQHTPSQLVILLTSLCEMGGRPPQAWLVAHEAALLDSNDRSSSATALSPHGWLLLLECYGRLMYRPSEAFESAFERYILGILPEGLGAQGLASLVGSIARLQLPVSPQLENGVVTRLEQVLPAATSAELQQLVEGLLMLDVQLPSSCLHSLCDVAQPHLASFHPQATCCLLQLLAVAGDYPPSPRWLAGALEGLEPQLDTLEALGALMLLQSLKSFHAKPPEGFMSALQDRLLLLLPKFDAMGVAAMMQGLVACGSDPNPALQAVLAGHIKKGLARPSQGMGATPVWLCLESVLQMRQPPAAAVLLDELLRQVAQQLRQAGAVSGSKAAQRLLPPLAAAITRGGVWGPGSGAAYTPSPAFCSALCAATLDSPSAIEPQLWLDLLVRFGDMRGSGFRPSSDWCRVATQQVFSTWRAAAAAGQQQGWNGAPTGELAGLLGAVGRLQQVPVELPGWPDAALQRLSCVAGELDGHQLAVALWGVAQQLTLAEMAATAAAAAAGSADRGLLDSSSSMYSDSYSSVVSNSGSGTGSWNDCSGDDAAVSSSNGGSDSSSREAWFASVIQGIAAANPQLLAAAEAASIQQLQGMSGDDLALLAHAMHQLGHGPSPQWVQQWADAVAHQLPGASAQSGVLLLAAAAGFQARPDPDWLHQLLQHCQESLQLLNLSELVALVRALQLLGYRLDEGFVRVLARAGQAKAAAVGWEASGGEGEVGESAWEAAAKRRMLLELQQLGS